MKKVYAAFCMAALAACYGCGSSAEADSRGWTGTMDTLPSGQVVVTNTAEPIWPEGDGWRVVEELRLGTVEGDGPDLFGRINALVVDPAGRVHVFDSQSQELRVFGADGAHVRTVGRRGGGPGEFAEVVMAEMGPDGNIWLVDPENNRISIVDTAGTFVTSRPTPGGFVLIPWPGGFDDEGYYYSPIFLPDESSDGGFRIGLERFDPEFQPVDTIAPPRDTDPSDRRFELRSEDRFMAARIPFTPTFRWMLQPSGTFWGLLTGDYKLFQITFEGDTLLTTTREFEPYPVTDEDMEVALARLEWFERRGGKIVHSRIPSSKPPVEEFFFDDEGNVWVVRITTQGDASRVIDVFDPEGRYLGELRLPFPISWPYPVIRGSTMWAVTQDELEVPYVVRARIEKP